MPRDLILGTAGHIDHGKTSLVKALTGIDTDRLPEEKARGITIDIGFAELQLGEFRLGVVDVPGHERFVKNMLAGATGIDLALLIVAADDSVMPQTREHFEILKLLGVKRGVIALTKIDLVDETTREVAALEIRELVAGSFLDSAELIPVSSHTGQGIEELKIALEKAAGQLDAGSPSDWFRLPIDRAFVVQGHGTVVTGSSLGGSLKLGEAFDWHKGDGSVETVRARGLNNHGKSVEEIHRGQRAAVNLAGVPHERVRRGQELARPGYLIPSKVLTVQLLALSGHRRGLKHRLPVRVHLGTAEILGGISLLDCDVLEPGGECLAQLFLEEPATAVWGQPFIVRDSSAETTLGGGRVLQPTATKIRRRHSEPIEWVGKLPSENVIERATAFAWFAAFDGFAPDDLVREIRIAPEEVAGVSKSLLDAGMVLEFPLAPTRTLSLHAGRVDELTERLLAILDRLHKELPLLSTHDRAKVLAELDYIGDPALLQAIADRLIQKKKIVGDLRRIARYDFRAKLSANQKKLKERILADFRTGGFQPPEISHYSSQIGGNAAVLADLFEVCCSEGDLVRIADGIYLHAEWDAKMRADLTAKMADGKGLTVAEIRDQLGTTRKFAIPICEYLDKSGFTKRDGDLRMLANQPTPRT